MALTNETLNTIDRAQYEVHAIHLFARQTVDLHATENSTLSRKFWAAKDGLKNTRLCQWDNEAANTLVDTIRSEMLKISVDLAEKAVEQHNQK